MKEVPTTKECIDASTSWVNSLMHHHSKKLTPQQYRSLAKAQQHLNHLKFLYDE